MKVHTETIKTTQFVVVGNKRYRIDSDGNLIAADSVTEKLYRDGKGVGPKSTADRNHILEALSQNRLLRSLDKEQREHFVRNATLLEYEPGELILKEGERGDNVYAMQEGHCDVMYGDRKLSIKTCGDSFGEGAIVYDCLRGATIRATTPVKVWAISKDVFLESVLQSYRLQEIFNRYSSLETKQGDVGMTHDDFIRSVLDLAPSSSSSSSAAAAAAAAAAADDDDWQDQDPATAAAGGAAAVAAAGGTAAVATAAANHAPTTSGAGAAAAGAAESATAAAVAAASAAAAAAAALVSPSPSTPSDDDDGEGGGGGDAAAADAETLCADADDAAAGDDAAAAADDAAAAADDDAADDAAAAAPVDYSGESDTAAAVRLLSAMLVGGGRGGQGEEPITYPRFALFHLLLARPDSEYELAYLLFDKRRRGFVAFEDFVAVMEGGRGDGFISWTNSGNSSSSSSSGSGGSWWSAWGRAVAKLGGGSSSSSSGEGGQEGFAFNYDCDLVRNYFGRNRQRLLRSPAFQQFFIKLQEEIAVQAFHKYDYTDTGLITAQDFYELLTCYGGWKMPHGVYERLKVVCEMEGEDASVPFSQFTAFKSVIMKLPAVCCAIRLACQMQGSGSAISKDQFKLAAKRLVAMNLSPLEVNAVFQLFDTDNDGMVRYEDCCEVLRSEWLGSLLSNELETSSSLFWGDTRGGGGDDSDSAAAAADQGWVEWMVECATEFAQHFAMGSIAGGVGASAVYPIDLVKTRMQNQRTPLAAAAEAGPASAASAAAAGPAYRNSWHCFTQVVSKEGPIGLYRGLLPQLVGVAPEKAIKLSVNDLLRKAFSKEAAGGGPGLDLPLEILAGCGAGASQVVFTNPLEITKIRLQVQGETQQMLQQQAKEAAKHARATAAGAAESSVIAQAEAAAAAAAAAAAKPQPTALQVVKELGVVGLYRGAGACLLRDIPFSGIYFPAYAACKRYLAGLSVAADGSDGLLAPELAPAHLLLAGAVAGMPAASLTTPADVIKTRLQVEARCGETTYRGISECAAHIYATEGVRAFFKGAGMRVFRSSPQFGITLVAYELLHSFIGPQGVAPRPPTNAPVPDTDYEAMRRSHVASRLADLEHMMSALRPGPR